MIVLLPCYSLESLSLERDSSEVNELLSGWSALYHPALLEKTQKLPGWDNASSPAEGTPIELVVVPPCCESTYLEKWLTEKSETGTFIVREKNDRTEIVSEILEKLELSDHGFDEDFVADCYAFGTAYFWTEVITRQMRYMSMLDETQLKTRILAAVTAAREGNSQEARESLREAFEMLAQSKEYFYPGTTYLVNLTLTASSTLGEPLREELCENEFTNLYLPTTLLREVYEKEPQTLLLLRKALHPNANPEFLLHLGDETKQATLPGETAAISQLKTPGSLLLIGDDLDEHPLAMLPILEVADRLVQGVLLYVQKLGVRPEFYGRMSKGYTPVLPQLLKLCAYEGAIHFAPRDGWKLPKEHQSRISWQGTDETKIETLQKFPLDADAPDTFFTIPHKMGYSSSSDQNVTHVLARHPGKKCPWMTDLLRASRYSSVLGRLSRLDEYFSNTKYSGVTKSFGFGKYWNNILLQSVRENRVDPVSSWSHYYRLLAEITALQTLLTLRTGIDRDRTKFESFTEKLEKSYTPVLEGIEESLFGEKETTVNESEEKDSGNENSRFKSIGDLPKPVRVHTFASTEKRRREIEQLFLDEVAFAIYGKPIEEIEKLSDAQIEKLVGVLLVNPLSFARTMRVDISELPKLPKAEGNVRLVREFKHAGELRKEAVAEVPPYGFLWIGPGNVAEEDAEVPSEIIEKNEAPTAPSLWGKFKTLLLGEKKTVRNEPPLIEQVAEKIERRGHGIEVKDFYLLRNDYFEVRIDVVTGEMRSLKTFNVRGNRFAHHLAFRVPQEDRQHDPRGESSPHFGYTISCADHFELLSAGPLCGRLRVHGRLMRQDGTLAAKFVETYTIERLSRVLALEITIEPALEPGDKPWDSYYGARFAWNDPMTDVFAGVNGGSYLLESELLQAPEFVDVREENGSISILCGGLPFHRLHEGGRLDTILIPKGETATTFRLGIGVDLPHVYQSAQEFLLDDFAATGMIPAPQTPAAWLFSLGVKNVVILRIEPLFEKRTFSEETQGESAFEQNDTLTGFRLILLETENTHSNFSLRSFLPLKKAFKTDLLRNIKEERPIEDDRVKLEMHPREVLPLEIYL